MRRTTLPLGLVLLLLAPLAGAAAPRASKAPAGLAVQGRVLAAGGAPLAGAKVLLLPYEGERERGERLLAGKAAPGPQAQGETGADGGFVLAAPEAGFWTLRVEAAGHVAQESDLLPLVEEIELEAVELARDRPLAVEVVGPDGKAVAGAWIAASPAGSDRLRGVFADPRRWRPAARLLRRGEPPGDLALPRGSTERLTVRAFAPGFREAEAEVAAARKSVTLTLAPAGLAAAFEVRDAAGRPVAGALLAGGEGRWPLGLTAGDGRLVAPPPAAEGKEVHALAAGGRSAAARLRAVPPTDAKESKDSKAPAATVLTLPAAGPVAGRVLDAHRREPLPGALVWSWGDPAGAARTDRAGGYRIAAVPAGTWRAVSAVAPGFLPGEERVPPGAGEERGPTLALQPAVRLRGRVMDAATKGPLAGVEVRATPSPSGPFAMRFVFDLAPLVARTGADGRFTLGAAAARVTYELRLSRTGYAPKIVEVPPVEPGGAAPPPLELALDRGRRAGGLVLDESARPVAGATVTLAAAPATDDRRRFRMPDEPAPPRFGATSDPRGRFEIAGLPAGRYDLTAQAAGYAPREVPGLEVPAGEGEQALGTVILRPGAALEGRVVDPRGQPIGEAEVRVAAAGRRTPFGAFFLRERDEPVARSGLDGWFRVADLAPGQSVDVQVYRRGYATAEVPGVVPPAEPLGVTLQPAVRIAGRVVDPAGEPIAGARVALAAEHRRGGGFSMRSTGSVTSDAEGRFLFEEVEPGTLRVMASAEGRQSAELAGVQAVAGRDVADLELVLAPGASVSGRVLDAEGRGAAGVMVQPVEEDRAGSRLFRGTTADGDGWYVLDGLPTGPRSISAEDEQGRRAVGELEVRPGENRLDLRLAAGAEVAGRVVDADGAPLAGAEVGLLPPGQGWTRLQASTGADGAFRFEGVEPGEYRARASKEGYATVDSEPLRIAGAPVGGLELRLAPGGAIVGRVLGLEAEALPHVEIGALRREAMERKSTRVDFEGRYRVAAVAPGEWRVSAEISGTGRRAEGRVTLPQGASEVTLDLDFATGFTLSGRVVRGGAPASGAVVSADGSDVADRGEAQTDLDGLFRITGLEAGSYDVTAQAGTAVVQEKVTLDADREVVLELAVAAVAGRVVDAADRAPLAAAAVRLESAEEGQQGPWWLSRTAVTTDAQGRFRLAEVAAGRWRLRVERDGYAAGVREVTVREGVDVEDLEVELDATSGLVVEVVRAAGGAPPAARVAVVDGTGRAVLTGWFQTGPEGRMRLKTVPAGSFEVLAVADGLAVGRAPAVVPGPPVRLALAPAAAVELRVPALAGNPALVKVAARGADGAPLRFPGWGDRVESEWNMTHGHRRLDGLPAGAWTIEARSPDGRVWSGGVTLAPGQTAELVLE